MRTYERYNTVIDTIFRYSSKVSISYQSCFVSAIMLAIMYQLGSDDLVSRGECKLMPMVLEDLVSFHRLKFKLASILSLHIAIVLVNLNSMLVILRYFIAIFELDS